MLWEFEEKRADMLAYRFKVQGAKRNESLKKSI